MCKIMAVAGIKNDKQTQAMARALMKAARAPMTAGDKDGFGLATIDSNGDIFAEKWLNPEQAFKLHESLDPIDLAISEKYGALVDIEEVYTSTGTPTESISAFILHSRMATCEKSITNTHPFLSDDGKTALIHNGVIRNAHMYLKNTTCDSEALLTQYDSESVSLDPDMINKALKPLTGYYACAVLGSDDAGTPYLDIFKESMSQLYLIRVEGLFDVFCTAPHIAIAALKGLRAKKKLHYRIHKCGANQFLRMNAITGEVMHRARLVIEKSVYTPSAWSQSYKEGSYVSRYDDEYTKTDGPITGQELTALYGAAETRVKTYSEVRAK